MIEIRQGTAPQAEAERRIDALLDAHADAAGHPFNPVELAFEAWEGETYLGGVALRTVLGWTFVKLLAVADRARGRQLGQRLLRRAEDAARAQGCTGIWLDTFSFQAPGFYEALGYERLCTLPDGMGGVSRNFYAKRLDHPASPGPVRAAPGFTDWPAVAQLLAQSFAYMTERLGHPARAAQATAADLAAEADAGTVFLVFDGATPVACLFCRPSHDDPRALYVGKLAVAASHRAKGLARRLIDVAAIHAQAMGFTSLTLDTGQDFPDLHATFRKLGFGPPVPRPGEPGVVTMHRALDVPTTRP